MFPGVTSSFSLGTGYKMGTLTSKCGFAIKPATNALGLVSLHPHTPYLQSEESRICHMCLDTLKRTNENKLKSSEIPDSERTLNDPWLLG